MNNAVMLARYIHELIKACMKGRQYFSNPHLNSSTLQAVTFDSCSSLKVDNLKFKNSQKMHVSFERCTNVQVSNLVISALGTSPNTDGIHVTKTTNIRINNCVIGTGTSSINCSNKLMTKSHFDRIFQLYTFLINRHQLTKVMIASPSLVVLNTSMLPTYFVDQDMESGSSV